MTTRLRCWYASKIVRQFAQAMKARGDRSLMSQA
jgi:hypothetical protein